MRKSTANTPYSTLFFFNKHHEKMLIVSFVYICLFVLTAPLSFTGFSGNPDVGCSPIVLPPTNPCIPSPCGTDSVCEVDNGNPICSCPRGKTGNPFVRCIPDGPACKGNVCGPNAGCRLVGSQPVCFCLPRFEGNPPAIPCVKPVKACNPNPCGANTECMVVNSVQRCTCRPGFKEAINTIQVQNSLVNLKVLTNEKRGGLTVVSSVPVGLVLSYSR